MIKDWDAEYEIINREHPEMYQQFRLFALQLLQAGRTRISHGTIIERMRWESAINAGPDYKINQNFGRPMAENFVSDYPEYEGVFEFRKRGERPAYDTRRQSQETPEQATV